MTTENPTPLKDDSPAQGDAYFIPDTEGKKGKNNPAISLLQEEILKIQAHRTDVQDDQIFFLGDLFDNEFELDDLLYMNKHPEINRTLGNREANKSLRIPGEIINISYINNFAKEGKAPYWDNTDRNKPLTFLKKQYKDEHKTAEGEAETAVTDEILQAWYKEKSFIEKMTLVLKWTFEKTMGAPARYDALRSGIVRNSDLTEDAVTDTIVNLVCIAQCCKTENEFQAVLNYWEKKQGDYCSRKKADEFKFKWN